MALVIPIGQEQLYLLTDEFTAGIPEELFCLRIDELYFSILVYNHDCVGSRLQEIPELFLITLSQGYVAIAFKKRYWFTLIIFQSHPSAGDYDTRTVTGAVHQ